MIQSKSPEMVKFRAERARLLSVPTNEISARLTGLSALRALDLLESLEDPDSNPGSVRRASYKFGLVALAQRMVEIEQSGGVGLLNYPVPVWTGNAKSALDAFAEANPPARDFLRGTIFFTAQPAQLRRVGAHIFANSGDGSFPDRAYAAGVALGIIKYQG